MLIQPTTAWSMSIVWFAGIKGEDKCSGLWMWNGLRFLLDSKKLLSVNCTSSHDGAAVHSKPPWKSHSYPRPLVNSSWSLITIWDAQRGLGNTAKVANAVWCSQSSGEVKVGNGPLDFCLFTDCWQIRALSNSIPPFGVADIKTSAWN